VSEVQEFAGKVAIVTGAGRGIGETTARLLAARGAKVALLDRHGDGVAAIAAEVSAGGGEAVGVQVDVTDAAAVTEAVGTVTGRWGGVDVLVANHTLHPCGGVLDTEPFEWDLSLQTNVGGTYLMARAVLPSMIARGGGAIVGLGSDCAVRSCRDAAAYVASKAAIVGLMRSIAVDHGADNVRANVVIPGATDTPGLREVYTNDRDLEESSARAAAQSPLNRLGRPEDVAEVIAFACSDRAAFVTGAELMADGGMTIGYSAD